MEKHKMQYDFCLPISVENKDVCYTFIPFFYEHKKFFIENVNISAVYGSPNCYWNGGRLNFSAVSIEKMKNFKMFIEKYNIPFRFTFSNNQLLECHLQDYYCNKLLEIFANNKHEIIVNSTLLENYIRNKYGNKFKYISSTTKVLTNPDEQKAEIKKDYYLVVLDYRYNTDINFLKSIENKNKCELLVNSVCNPNCKRRKEHYDNLSLGQLNQGFSKDVISCESEIRNLYDCLNLSTFIKAEQIDKYIYLGFSHFKIEGRTFSKTNLIDTLLYYLVKDEYKMTVKEKLYRAIYR